MHVLIAVAALALVVSVIMWALSPSTEKIQTAWSELSAPFQASNKDLPTLCRAQIETSPALAQETHLKTWLQGLSNNGLQALVEKPLNSAPKCMLIWIGYWRQKPILTPMPKQQAKNW